MTPTSHRKTEHARGFTLIEMLVVLVIVALLGAVAVSRLSNVVGLGTRARTMAFARTSLERAREQAMLTGKPTAANLAMSGTLPIEIADSRAGDRIMFYVDGSSSGGTIRMGGRALLRVDWLTGAVDAA